MRYSTSRNGSLDRLLVIRLHVATALLFQEELLVQMGIDMAQR